MSDTYYKLVSVKRKNKKVIRTSWLDNKTAGEFAVPLPSFMTVRYIPGKVTKPKVKGTKLMVFGSLVAAKHQAQWLEDRLYNYQLWKCTVTNPRQIFHVKEYVTITNTSPDELQKLWNALNSSDNCYTTCSLLEEQCKMSIDLALQETYACDTVTLTKEIDLNE